MAKTGPQRANRPSREDFPESVRVTDGAAWDKFIEVWYEVLGINLMNVTDEKGLKLTGKCISVSVPVFSDKGERLGTEWYDIPLEIALGQ